MEMLPVINVEGFLIPQLGKPVQPFPVLPEYKSVGIRTSKMQYCGLNMKRFHINYISCCLNNEKYMYSSRSIASNYYALKKFPEV